ncbi:MAG: type II secretion system protein GspJ [Candidatus Brocadiia bacterium]
MHAERANRGFTLLEMLVAMTLMAVLAGALYASLSAGFRGRRVTEAALEPARRGTAALALLGPDLDCAVPPTGLLAGEFLGEEATGEDGEPADAVRFHALAREQSGAAPPFPMRKVELSLATDVETGETALLRRTVHNLLAPEEPEPTEEVLCRGVRALELAYYDGSAWMDSWDSTTAGDVLPLAVSVTVLLDVEGREEDYEVSRVFALPCGETAEEGTGTGGGMGGTRQ